MPASILRTRMVVAAGQGAVLSQPPVEAGRRPGPKRLTSNPEESFSLKGDTMSELVFVLRKSAASNYYALLPGIPTYSASASLLSAGSCCMRPSPLALDVIGVYNGTWVSAYDAFIRNLRSSVCPSRFLVRQRRATRWHAKVFIAKESGVGSFGMIGSSNLTRPASREIE